jgi:hypothetical protein
MALTVLLNVLSVALIECGAQRSALKRIHDPG